MKHKENKKNLQKETNNLKKQDKKKAKKSNKNTHSNSWEKDLKYRLEIEKIISEISSNFINLSLDEIDDGIIYALNLIGIFSNIEKIQLFAFSDNLTNTYLTHEWNKKSVDFQEIISVQAFIWLIGKLKKFENVNVSSLSKSNTDQEKEILEASNIKSVLFVPIVNNKNLVGFLSFYSIKKVKLWSKEDISLLKIVGEIFVNTLERKHALEKWKVLVESTDDSILISDFDTAYYIEANPAARKLFGYSLDEFRQLKEVNLHPAEVSDLVDKISFNLNNYGNSYHPGIKMVKKDGSIFWGSIKGNVYVVAGQKLLVVIVRDITEQKKAEEKLKESERQLSQAQKIAHIGSWENDLLTGTITWSDELYRIFGLPPQGIELNLEKILTYIDEKDRTSLIKIIEKTLTTKEPFTMEYGIKHSDRTIHIIDTYGEVITDNDNNPVKLIVTAQDITEKKKLEAQFLRNQRMESIGTLTGGIAHDLNNVLAPIMIAIAILKLDISDEKRKKVLSTLETTVKRGSDIIKQLLLFARGESDEEKITIDVSLLIENISQIIIETFPKSISLVTSIPENLNSVTGNITQLEQMLLNLCVNARDSMPNGGKLTISAENIFTDRNFTQMNIQAKVGNYVSINVSDTGTGIDAEIIDKIFEPFFTTKELGKGTGLGLSSAMGIIKGHNGFITLNSIVRKGTDFKVFFPAVTSSHSEYLVNNDDWEGLRGNGELILVIDDEVAILELVKESLEAFGYNILTSDSGLQGIELFKSHKNTIKVVLSDISMPVMDGLIMAKVLKIIDPLVKVILSSGLTSSQQELESSGYIGNFFIKKPYSTIELLKKIKGVLKN